MSANFENILKQAQKEWMDVEGVLSVGQGKKGNQDCIDVYVVSDKTKIEKRIPSTYKNVPVVIRESGGAFKPQNAN